MELSEESEPATPSGFALARALPRERQIATATLSALLVVACFVRFGLSGRAVVSGFVASVLVLLTAVDLDRRLIPNVIVLPTTALVLAAQIALYPDHAFEWIIASLGAALFFFVPLLIYPAGMGMGDVKLAALLGAALGESVVAALFVGLLAGAAFAIFVLVHEGKAARKKTIAYGPFLALGGVVVLLLGGR